MTYRVQLPVFEGPLDLLLHLIKMDQIDIYDIPIAKIADQYLEHLEVMKLLDLEIAGEFLLMAATLMHIKSKMLLPAEEKEEEATEEPDPREELVRRLLEYKKFKEAAVELKDMQQKQRDSFTRLSVYQKERLTDEADYLEASLFDLITAFSKVLQEFPKKASLEVSKDEFTVSDKIHQMLHILVEKPSVYFRELFKDVKHRDEIVAIFLALLELVKLREVIIEQKTPFGAIKIIRNPLCQMQ